jgi:hypothetical protein
MSTIRRADSDSKLLRDLRPGAALLAECSNPANILRTVWVGRWLEDEIANGRLRRVRRSEVLGEKKEGEKATERVK